MPQTHRFLLRVSRRIARLGSLAQCALTTRATVRAASIAMLAAALNGTAFACLLAAFADLNTQEALIAAAAFNLAGAAGVAAVPVPSGIGVREAVLIGLLHGIVPLEVATAAAILARAGGIMLDVGLGAAGAAVFALRARNRRSATASYSPSPLSSRPS
jgi:uncharacterized membrane protein YbhN (UPF0104 family)